MTADETPPRVVSSVRLGDDEQFEAGLRPRSLGAYIGQERLRENLEISIAATRQRGEALDHVLLYGPPGLGKTTLAHVVGYELGVPVRTTAGPVLEKPGDSGRHSDEPRAARGALHRRDSSDESGRRRDPVSGNGGLRARHRHRGRVPGRGP